MDDQKDEYLTPEDVAKKLKLKKVTIYRMIRRGEIPGVKMGKMWRVSAKQLAKLFEP